MRLKQIENGFCDCLRERGLFGQNWFTVDFMRLTIPMSRIAVLVLLLPIFIRLTALPGAEPQAAYPPSKAIRSIEWAPVSSIVRMARDGDNWPVTWGQDDAIYTTWGDGTGFNPKVERKLSCGFARVVGPAEGFTGTNIRSPAEQLGAGRKGKKGWGILSIGGTLYLWLGHADLNGGGMQLAWSRDYGRSWTFADWRFDDFGMIGFINFGRDYSQARDEYVYAYSHDGPRADTPAGQFILMRVPKARLTERTAWEFYMGCRPDGRVDWTSDKNQRVAVFQNQDSCLRSAMTFCAGLKRYLWWQQIPLPEGARDRGDTRFEGGFAIYDAPEPWGPWTTAYFTRRWDVGPGEHGDFPAKWMSGDGQSLYLVFSGDDSFSVRRATVVLNNGRNAPDDAQ